MGKNRYVGIDISKRDLHVAYEYLSKDRIRVKKRRFSNTFKEYSKLNEWIKQNLSRGERIQIVMEVTGSYYENIASYLYEEGHIVSVINPVRIKAFGESTGVRTKTDNKDPLVMVHYGKVLDPGSWTPET